MLVYFFNDHIIIYYNILNIYIRLMVYNFLEIIFDDFKIWCEILNTYLFFSNEKQYLNN